MDTSTLARTVWGELRTLSKENAEGVGEHLAAVGLFISAGDFDRALAHAKTATRRAGRVAVVRETLGMVHYYRGEWARALAEFRTARRLSGSDHLLPYLADVERGLGRPERAIEVGTDPAATRLEAAAQVELAIVVAGARCDLGQFGAATQLLRDVVDRTRAADPWAARAYYAYADALLADGQNEAAREWFATALDADRDETTDADERLAQLDGIVLTDLDPDRDVDVDHEAEPEGGETSDPSR